MPARSPREVSSPAGRPAGADTRATIRIGIVLLPSCNALATLAFVDPFRAVNYLRGANLYAWDLFTCGPNTLQASNGITITGLQALPRRAPELDLVLVSSSWEPEQFGSKPLYKWLRQCSERGAALGGIDTGAVLLARAGLLDGYRATVHYEHLAAFRELFPHVTASEALFVIDRNRLSCCGGHAATDLALELIRLQHGTGLANAAARYVFHDRLRSAAERQTPAQHEPVGYAIPAKLRQAIMLMERNLEAPYTLSRIAATVCLSQRQLERLFTTHTGVRPVRYYLDVRLNRARGLITQTSLSVLEIALACGFASPSYFARAYKRRFKLTPLRDRVEGRIPFQFRSFPAHATSET